MKKAIVILPFLILAISCNQKPKPFEYTICGKVAGRDSDEICLFESPRVGDQIIIPFKDGTFEYRGEALEVVITWLTFYDDLEDGRFTYFPIILEPGIIEIELDADDIREKSRILSGEINQTIQDVNKVTSRYWESVFNDENTREEKDKLLKNVYGDSIALLIEQNADNYGGVYLLNRYSGWEIFSKSQLASIFEKIEKPMLRQSSYFKEIYSDFLANQLEVNKIGTKALNFSLPDSTGKNIDFHTIAEDKIVFVESSGSWCGNQTRETHELDPIYDKYHDKGFEIVTVVLESKYDRWGKWVRNEKFPWVNLIELEYGNTNDVFYSQQLFLNGDYLVDEKGFVIANDLSPAKLNELLIERYEPEQYKEYLKNKWTLPEGTYILDKDQEIKSFEELALQFTGKGFFIDCWATWCSPCIEEFQYNKSLKEFLVEHRLEMVYISFDNNLADEKWLSFIRKHELDGHHMRANEAFRSDFIGVSGWNQILPSYLIVSKNGRIVENDALRPSEKDKLYKQILSTLSN